MLLEAAVLAAAAAVTALLAARLTRPLAVLTDAGQQIAAGDYARRTALHTGDEIETLSASFDKMADAVQEKIADLEADVQKREDFVGAFTHELKTPMTSIIGYADILAAMQTDPDEQREAAAAIAHEGRRLESLSHKLLALLGLAECPLTPAAVPLAALWPRLHAACPGVNLSTPAAPGAHRAGRRGSAVGSAVQPGPERRQSQQTRCAGGRALHSRRRHRYPDRGRPGLRHPAGPAGPRDRAVLHGG